VVGLPEGVRQPRLNLQKIVETLLIQGQLDTQHLPLCVQSHTVAHPLTLGLTHTQPIEERLTQILLILRLCQLLDCAELLVGLDERAIRRLALAHAIENRANVGGLVIDHGLGYSQKELGVRLLHLRHGYHLK
jgi:hypothetical protein